MNKQVFVCFISVGCLSGLGLAQENVVTANETVAPKVWQANIGLSAIVSTGNSSNQTVGTSALTSYQKEQYKIEWTADGAYGRAKDSTTGISTTNTKNWKTRLRYDYFVSKPMAVFGAGHIGMDELAGFDLRYGSIIGFAHELIKTNKDMFKYEVGFDSTREERTVPPDDNVYSGRVYFQYKREISKWATFFQDVESLLNVEKSKDIRLNTLTGLNMKLTDTLAFQAGYSLRFDNEPVSQKKKMDTMTQIGLVMNLL